MSSIQYNQLFKASNNPPKNINHISRMEPLFKNRQQQIDNTKLLEIPEIQIPDRPNRMNVNNHYQNNILQPSPYDSQNFINAYQPPNLDARSYQGLLQVGASAASPPIIQELQERTSFAQYSQDSHQASSSNRVQIQNQYHYQHTENKYASKKFSSHNKSEKSTLTQIKNYIIPIFLAAPIVFSINFYLILTSAQSNSKNDIKFDKNSIAKTYYKAYMFLAAIFVFGGLGIMMDMSFKLKGKEKRQKRWYYRAFAVFARCCSVALKVSLVLGVFVNPCLIYFCSMEQQCYGLF